jgi:multisubunit Na+/H+ antiporter MnhE subunit
VQTSRSRDENLSTEILLLALGFAFLVGAFSPRGLFLGLILGFASGILIAGSIVSILNKRRQQ